MNCSKCGREIPGSLLACRYCAKVASAIIEKRTNDRYEAAFYDRVLRSVQPIWVQDCLCSGSKVQHLAICMSMDSLAVAFCGHDITFMGKGKHPMGCQNVWKPEYADDPELCPLCVDRLLNRGGGICANVCPLCGKPDGKHRKQCDFRYLSDKKLVAKLGGLPSDVV